MGKSLLTVTQEVLICVLHQPISYINIREMAYEKAVCEEIIRSLIDNPNTNEDYFMWYFMLKLDDASCSSNHERAYTFSVMHDMAEHIYDLWGGR